MKPLTPSKIQLFSACVVASALVSVFFNLLWELTTLLPAPLKKYAPFSDASLAVRMGGVFFILLAISYDMLRLRLLQKGADHWQKMTDAAICCKESYVVLNERPIIKYGLMTVIGYCWVLAVIGFMILGAVLLIMFLGFGSGGMLNLLLMIGSYVVVAAVIPPIIFLGVPLILLALSIWIFARNYQ